MAQIFHRRVNTLSRLSIFGAVFIITAIAIVAGQVIRSPYVTEARVVRVQPVPFSHKHHVAGLGIDCRYCHSSVESSPFAGMPPTKTCMKCHSQVWADSSMLEPVRKSFKENKSIEWIRVNSLPDYVYFDHSIHVNKGVGCVTCHGQVDEMPLMWRENTLHMEWCLDCHRQPERFLRPRDRVFDMRWTPPADQLARGKKLLAENKISSAEQLTNCSTCHR